MTENQNKNLQDYFSKAREQEVKFSAEDTKNILSKRTAHNGLNKHAGGGAGMTLFSGGKRLYTLFAAALTAVIIMFLYYNNFNFLNNEKKTADVLNRDKIEAVRRISSKISKDDNKTVRLFSKALDTPVYVEVEISSRSSEDMENAKEKNTIDIDGVNLIKVNKSQLSDLGISVEDGTAVLYAKDPSGMFSGKISVSESKFNIEKVSNEEVPKGYVSPTFVSKANGYKILSLFTGLDKHFLSAEYTTESSSSMDLVKDLILKNSNLDSALKDKLGGKVKSFSASFNIIDSFTTSKDIDLNDYILNFDKDSINKKLPQIVNRKQLEELSNKKDSAITREDLKYEISLDKVSKLISEVMKVKSDTSNGSSDKNFSFSWKIQNKTPEIEKKKEQSINEYIRVNKMIPVAYAIDGEIQYIFWFDPGQKLISKLPEKYRKELKKEYESVPEDDQYCEAIIPGQETYFDIWRSCNGSMKYLKVNPNPATDIINLSVELDEPCIMNISLHNLNGKKITDIKNNINAGRGKFAMTVNLSRLDSGMYLVVITNNKGEQVVQRIIKQ